MKAFVLVWILLSSTSGWANWKNCGRRIADYGIDITTLGLEPNYAYQRIAEQHWVLVGYAPSDFKSIMNGSWARNFLKKRIEAWLRRLSIRKELNSDRFARLVPELEANGLKNEEEKILAIEMRRWEEKFFTENRLITSADTLSERKKKVVEILGQDQWGGAALRDIRSLRDRHTPPTQGQNRTQAWPDFVVPTNIQLYLNEAKILEQHPFVHLQALAARENFLGNLQDLAVEGVLIGNREGRGIYDETPNFASALVTLAKEKDPLWNVWTQEDLRKYLAGEPPFTAPTWD